MDKEVSPEMLALIEKLKKWDPILNPNINRIPLSELVLIESEEQVCIEEDKQVYGIFYREGVNEVFLECTLDQTYNLWKETVKVHPKAVVQRKTYRNNVHIKTENEIPR